MVLCEGVYGYDNASLWGVGKNASFEVFSCSNKRKLGDTANDLIKVSDSINIIIVSTSNEIIKIDNQGTMIASFQVAGPGHFLKKACIINDSILAITDLYADKVYLLNHVNMTLDSLQVSGLCAPDGIAFGNGQLVIVNSGYGIFRYTETNASTFAIYDFATQHIEFLKTGVNPQNVIYDSEMNQWIIQYAHLTTMPDSSGGLIIYDQTFKEQLLLRGQYLGNPVRLNASLYALCGKLIKRVNLETLRIDTVYSNITRNEWYRIGKISDKLYICNARNFTLPGTVIILNPEMNAVESEYVVGINPRTLIEIND
jgi:hypothetical protein